MRELEKDEYERLKELGYVGSEADQVFMRQYNERMAERDSDEARMQRS
jgi:hypothetical protein